MHEGTYFSKSNFDMLKMCFIVKFHIEQNRVESFIYSFKTVVVYKFVFLMVLLYIDMMHAFMHKNNY